MAFLPDDLHALAQRHHDEPHRGYHGWSHPQALLALADEITEDLCDPVAVEAAILFHDAIYDPRASDNERRSAELADRVLAGHISDASRARAVRLIDATARHAIPDDLPEDEIEDMARFLDLDLSILGAPAQDFDAYEAGVRHEYAHIPAAVFAQGRAAILRRFLERDRLYLSDWGLERFEAAARANLRRSINALEAG